MAFKGTSLLREVHWNGLDISPELADKTQLPIPTMDKIILSAHFVTGGLQTEHFLDCLKISVKHEKVVERLTLGQIDDPAWQNLTKGR